ncbi:MAG: protein serine/threonine phosphatase [Bacteroidetes bacterium]|nr:protein serine/threonine phosphatase [Bacteroidota bacterium]
MNLKLRIIYVMKDLRAKHVLLLLCLLCAARAHARVNADSMELAISSAPDTLKVNYLLKLSDNYNDSDPKKGIECLNRGYAIAKRINNPGLIAKVTNQLGNNYYYLGDYEKAVRNFLETLAANEAMKNAEGIADCLNNIGSVYIAQHDFKKALEYHFKALKMREENVKNGIGSKEDISMSYGNIGQAYYYLNDFTKAMEFYNKSLRIAEDTGNKRRIALMLNNIGSIYAEQKFYDNALAYFRKSLEVQKETDNRQMVAMALNNVAEVYFMKNDFKNAIDFYNQGLVVAKEIGDLDDLKTSYEGLHNCYLGQKDFEKAHEYLTLFYSIKDSIYNSENSAQINEMLARFDTNKKEQEIQLLQKDQEIHLFWRNAWIIGCALIFLVALLLYNRNKVKQKANIALSEQKKEIELKNSQLASKNKEVTDSIKYAKHLQLAILPPQQQVKRLLPDSFILYKPKDIVSGDFYWVEEWGSKILVAAADCTGHGVPGAFMSIVGSNLLQQAVFNYGLSKPCLILNSLNKNISNILHQSEETATVRDGMDIALLSIDKTSRIVEFAGAYNPLWLVRNNELIEFAPDKHPVGAFVGEELKQFKNREFESQPGDVLYIFTDGYADQFGGPKGKKFKYSQLKELLLKISRLEMGEQKNLLNSTIESWKGQLEQIDDILIMGIRIS